MPATSSATAAPPAPRVAWNRWDELPVPDLGRWSPTRHVAVVVPYYQALDALRFTLAALAHQTYPSELLEVVVVDDGSSPPLALPDDLDLGDLRVQVVHQEDRGFGASRARNNGARATDAEILLFLDCDMVPEPWQVEAHARWHHTASDLAVVGFRRHVAFDGIPVDAVAGTDPAVGLEPLFDGRPVQLPDWIHGHMARTDDLTSAHDDLFRPVASGNLSMRAEAYWRVGGFDETFTQWGAEDTELGYRLFVDGVLLVADREARCWHQGHGHEPTAEEKASLEDQRAKVAHLIAHRGFRSRRPGRTYLVPRVGVRVAVEPGTPRDAVVDTVESVLGGTFTDLVVVLAIRGDHPDATWLERQFGPDPRVQVSEADLDDLLPHTPVQVHVDAGVVVGPDAVATLVATLGSVDDPVGVLHATVPGRGPGDPGGMVQAWLTRARRRAARAAEEDQDVTQLAGDLFGERWLAGTDLGLHDRDADAPGPAAEQASVGEAANLDEITELWQVFRTLSPGERETIVSSARTALKVLGPRQRTLLMKVARRVMMVAVALRGLAGARSAGDAVRGLVRVLHAALPWSVYRALRQLGQPVARRLRRPS